MKTEETKIQFNKLYPADPNETVIVFGGIGMRKEFFDDLAQRFQEAGLNVVAPDYRDNEKIDHKEQGRDVKSIADFVRNELESEKVYSVSHSYGSSGIIKNAECFDKNVFVSPFTTAMDYLTTKKGLQAAMRHTVPAIVNMFTKNYAPLISDDGVLRGDAAKICLEMVEKYGIENFKNRVEVGELLRCLGNFPSSKNIETLKDKDNLVMVRRQDKTLNPNTQKRFAKKIGADVHEEDGDHFDIFTDKEMANAIIGFIQEN